MCKRYYQISLYVPQFFTLINVFVFFFTSVGLPASRSFLDTPKIIDEKKSPENESPPCVCGQPKSAHTKLTLDVGDRPTVLEPTDVFGEVAFEKNGEVVKTGRPNFAMRFAIGDEDDEIGKESIWHALDDVFHDLLEISKPDIVLSIHDEGKPLSGSFTIYI